jgi:hypothetical protein
MFGDCICCSYVHFLKLLCTTNSTMRHCTLQQRASTIGHGVYVFLHSAKPSILTLLLTNTSSTVR